MIETEVKKTKRPLEEKIAQGIVIVVGIVLFVYFLRQVSIAKVGLLTSVVFIVCITASRFLSLTLPQGERISVSAAFIIAGLLLFPLPNVLLILGVSFLASDLMRKQKPSTSRLFTNVGGVIILASLLSFLYSLIGGEIFLFKTQPISLISWDIVPVLILCLGYFLIETWMRELFFSFTRSMPIWSSWISSAKLLGSFYVALFSTGILIAIVYHSMNQSEVTSSLSLVIFVPLLVIIQYSFRLYLDMEKGYQNTISALSSAIEAQNPERLGHAKRVVDYAINIAKEMGVFGDELEAIGYAAVLHDIGKIGTEEDPLTLDTILKSQGLKDKYSHADYGADVLDHVDYLKKVSQIIRKHHEPYERMQGLNKKEYPLGARVICVASDFDELVHVESIDLRLSPKEALEKLKKEQGIIYDPKVIRALMSSLEKSGII